MTKKININYKILIPIILFSFISLISIYSASIYTSSDLGNLVIKQAIWYVIGWLVVIFIYRVGNEYVFKFSNILYIIGNLLLLLLLIFGPVVNSSKCWFVLPGIGSFQPSEFMKIFIMLELAFVIHNFRLDHKRPTMKDEFLLILKTFIIVLIPSILTFLEPDTGAVVIYFIIYISMLFVSGIRFRWFIIVSLVCFLLIGGVLLLYFKFQDIFINIFGNSLYYRLNRIFDWKSGSGIQYNNSIISIGSAGLFGFGLKHAPMYFPEASTDFIFSIYATTFGFIGVILLLGLIIFFDISVIRLSIKKINNFDKYILAGIIGMLLFQQIQNIGMTIGILPITGITLPFISYGGSSLISYMILVGLILNISNDKVVHYKYK